MDEWQKTLISTGCGFVAGLVAEPARTWIAAKAKARWMESGLLAEIKNTTEWLSRIVHDFPDEPEFLTKKLYEQLPRVNCEVFDHFYASERSSFYRVSGFGLYRDFAMDVKKRILMEPPPTPVEVADRFHDIIYAAYRTARDMRLRFATKVLKSSYREFNAAWARLKEYDAKRKELLLQARSKGGNRTRQMRASSFGSVWSALLPVRVLTWPAFG